MNGRKFWIPVILSGAVIFLFAIAFLWAPNDPQKIDLTIRLMPPSKQFPFGTDAMGRCALSRILFGGKATLGMVSVSAFFVLLISSPIGLAMGCFTGKKSWVGRSVLNAFTAFPQLVYLLVFVGAWGNSVFSMLVALTIAFSVRLVKLIAAKTEDEKQKAYVLCAIASGASLFRIMVVHVFPNLLREILVFLSLSCAEMILMVTSFSFVGLGLGADSIDWGNMILEAGDVSMVRPDLIFYPVAFVFLATFAFNKLSRQLE